MRKCNSDHGYGSLTPPHSDNDTILQPLLIQQGVIQFKILRSVQSKLASSVNSEMNSNIECETQAHICLSFMSAGIPSKVSDKTWCD